MPLATSPTSIIPLYLIPSVPFRRNKRPATNPLESTHATQHSTTRGTPYLAGSTSLLRCGRCLAHICPTTAIISKGFTGRHGRAYLVAPPTQSLGTITPPEPEVLARHHEPGNLPNTHVHRPLSRLLVTGAHTVSDISCIPCGVVLGWKYVDAEEESQKYKVGMFILETKRVVKTSDWENALPEDAGAGTSGKSPAQRQDRKDSGVGMEADETVYKNGDANVQKKDEAIEFDSQDEDECEDLFMGIWTPALAKKRRRTRLWRVEKEKRKDAEDAEEDDSDDNNGDDTN